MICAKRLDLFICENWFCYASSPTRTSDMAVQASMQQHGFSEQLAARGWRDKDKKFLKKTRWWSEKEIKSFVMLSVRPGSQDIIRRTESGGLPAGHAAPQEGGFSWATVHYRSLPKQRLHKSGTDNERSWHWTRSSFKLLAATAFYTAKTESDWRFTTVIYDLACTFMDMWCID